MQPRHRALCALQAGTRTRAFSSSPRCLAVSPYRRATQGTAARVLRDDSKRTQSTAAAATQAEPRARPSPAFNRDDNHHVSPLTPYKAPEMDHSFVGMTGGQIFHEMMLRQGVKHICACQLPEQTPMALFAVRNQNSMCVADSA